MNIQKAHARLAEIRLAQARHKITCQKHINTIRNYRATKPAVAERAQKDLQAANLINDDNLFERNQLELLITLERINETRRAEVRRIACAIISSPDKSMIAEDIVTYAIVINDQIHDQA